MLSQELNKALTEAYTYYKKDEQMPIDLFIDLAGMGVDPETVLELLEDGIELDLLHYYYED
jgi:hypothetical protein